MTEKTILVVDTDTETVQQIKSTLEPEGFTVFSAFGIKESVAAAKKINPSLIFVNIAMKDISGLEISKSIHEIEALQAIPIIIMTPHGGTIEPRYTATYGIIDFLKKPFGPKELISKMIDILEMSHVAESPVEEKSAFQSAGEESVPLSFEEELSGEEQKIREMSLSATPEELSVSHENGQIPDEISLREQGGSGERVTTPLQPEPVVQSDETKEDQKDKNEEDKEPVLLPDALLREDEIKKLLTKNSGAGWRNDLLVPIIGVLLIAIGAGFFLYKGLIQDTKTGGPVSPQAPATVLEQPQQSAPVSPQQDTQSAGSEKTQPPQSQAAAVKTAPLPSAQTAKSGPAPANKKDVRPKTSGRADRPKTSQPQKPAKSFYAVQIGLFKNKANAVALAKKYKGSNYNAFTLTHRGKNKQVFYRVLVGRFVSLKEAAAHAKNIQSKESIQPVIFHKR